MEGHFRSEEAALDEVAEGYPGLGYVHTLAVDGPSARVLDLGGAADELAAERAAEDRALHAARRAHRAAVL